uniref:Carotenoid cis-trans isomerase n=1 Tax=Rheinheimera sp. BAL341 TaxID=1708203 RepID=A0A486XXV6_9GAMM
MAVVAIIGGGIGGLIAAHVIKQYSPSSKVKIIEGGPRVGGLLGLSHQSGNYQFDIGTHIPAQTLIDELDQWLFGELYDDESWQIIHRIKGANYYQGRIDQQHHNIASQDIYDKLSDGIDAGAVPNLKQDYQFRFGEMLALDVFLPLIRKFVPYPAEDLEPEVKRYFALDRLSQHGGRNPSKHSGSSPLAETRINLANRVIPLAIYPKNGDGVYRWIKHLSAKLHLEGVEVLTNKKLVDLQAQEKKITAIKFADGATIACDYLIWSAPIESLAQIAEPELAASLKKFYSRTTIKILHFVFNKAFDVDSHYINCFSSEFDPYRITLYDNFAGHHGDGYRCTVEVVGERAFAPSCTADGIVQQLHKMGILSDGTQVLYRHETTIENGFPVRKVGASDAASALCDSLASRYSNLLLTGSAKPGVFFANDVMINTYSDLTGVMADGSLV